jgi:hypothetical protein
MPALTPEWVERDPVSPQPVQASLPFWDMSDAITTSEAARLLEMSSENVRVLARNGVLEFKPVGGSRFFSRKGCQALKSEREVFALLSGQRAQRVRVPYAAYRSGGCR